MLLQGETGTGKDVAASAIHETSARRDRPFIVVDCGSIPANLIESELFGHERGAFTGAIHRRVGAFEEASGGTIFLDEIGELPLDVQPKLLRVLEQRHVRRIGSNVPLPTDIRVIAATNRDLRVEVNAARFRSDLYYRLAVVNVHLPPLRERPEDIPVLVGRLADTLAQGRPLPPALTHPDFVARLQRGAWPGNVRELRNYLERCLVFESPLPLNDDGPATVAQRPDDGIAVDPTVGYDEARQRAMRAWEQRYVQALLRLHEGNVERAARAAGICRAYLYRLVARNRCS